MIDNLIAEKLEAKHPLEQVKYPFYVGRNQAFADAGETISALAAYVFALDSSGEITGLNLSSMVSATDYSNVDPPYASVEINGGTTDTKYRTFVVVTCSSGRIYVHAGDFKVVNLGKSTLP